MKARIQGVGIHMATFDFVFGASPALPILGHADSKTLYISAAEGQSVTAMTSSTPKAMHTYIGFPCFPAKSHNNSRGT